MAQCKRLEVFAALSFPVYDIENLLKQAFSVAVARAPVVASTSAMLGEIYVLWVVQLKNEKIKPNE